MRNPQSYAREEEDNIAGTNEPSQGRGYPQTALGKKNRNKKSQALFIFILIFFLFLTHTRARTSSDDRDAPYSWFRLLL